MRRAKENLGAADKVCVKAESEESVSELIFRPFRACSLSAFTHGLRRGLHSYAASRLIARVAEASAGLIFATP